MVRSFILARLHITVIQMSLLQVRGLYDYTAQGEDEISIQVGQRVELTDGIRGGQNYGDGWWEGVDAHGRRGIFPSNYVRSVLPWHTT